MTKFKIKKTKVPTHPQNGQERELDTTYTVSMTDTETDKTTDYIFKNDAELRYFIQKLDNIIG